MKSLCVLVSADSYLPHAKLVASALERAGWKVHTLHLKLQGGGISARQFQRFGYAFDISATISLQSIEQLLNQCDLFQYDAVFLGIPGTSVHAIDQQLIAHSSKYGIERPITLSCFPGVLYYTQSFGQWLRSNSDILLFNERRTFRDYTLLKRFFLVKDTGNAFLLGYPSLKDFPPAKIKTKSKETYVYVDQAILPKTYENRLALFTKLVELAELKPKTDLIFLSRSVVGEHSNHDIEPRLHCSNIVSAILDEKRNCSNVSISYQSPEEVLPIASLCIGISSTVLLAALHSGIPVASLVEEARSDPFNGYRLFRHSGFATSIQKIKDGVFNLEPSPNWLDDNIHVPGAAEENKLVEKIEFMCRSKIKGKPNKRTFWNKDFVEILCKKIDKIAHKYL